MLAHKILLHSIAITLAVATNISLIELVAKTPKCALPCLAANISPDMLANPAPSCNNKTLQVTILKCVTPVCFGDDLTQVALVNRKVCEGIPIPNKILEMAVTQWTLTIITLMAIGIRFYSRYAITKEIGYDDGLLAGAGLLLIANLAIGFYNGEANGFGRHFWDIDPFKVGALLKNLYFAEIIYNVIVTLVKASIIMFFLRVFPSRRLRIACYFLLAAVVGSGLAIIFLVVFQCRPISGAWDTTSLADRNKCLDLNTLIYAASYVGIGLDVAILAFPIPSCIALKMGLRKKLNVLFMFAFGIFATITSLVRLKFLGSFGKSTDPTFDNAAPAIWSVIESSVATICACLPSFRPVLARRFPKFFDISSDPSQYSHKIPQSTRSVYRRRPSYIRQNSARSSLEQAGMGQYSPVDAQKIGPMYNKRLIESPDDLLLRDIDQEEDEFFEKAPRAWEKPHFHDHMKVYNPTDSELPQNMTGSMVGRDAITPSSIPSFQRSLGSSFGQKSNRGETEIKVGMTFTPSMIANKRPTTPPDGPIGTAL